MYNIQFTHLYAQDPLYTFIITMLDSSNNKRCNIISRYCSYIITDWLPLMISTSDAFLNINSSIALYI